MSGPGQKSKLNDTKKISTLENKHRLKIKEFENDKGNFLNLEESLIKITNEINELDKMREKFTNIELK